MTISNTGEAIPQEELQKLVHLQAEVKEKNGENSGEYGEQVKAAADKYGINKKALSMICSLNRMTKEKRDDVLRSFDNFTVMMGWEAEPDMVDQMEATEEPHTSTEKKHEIRVVN